MASVHSCPTRPRTLPGAAITLLSLTLLASSVLTLAGCDSRNPPGTSGAQARATVAPQPGVWRATLGVAGGEQLPFGLELTREDGKLVGWLVNGAERTRVPEVALEEDRLTMRMPGFQNRIEARVAPGGRELAGELLLSRSKGQTLRVPFAAREGQRWRFFEEPPQRFADVSGRWAVTFGEGQDASIAVGEFVQQGAQVTGTFLTPTGDHRFLAGEVRGEELWLSRFDGGGAALYRAKLDPATGELEGSYIGATSASRLHARRDANASLGDADSRTQVRNAGEPLDIAFPDLDGRMVSLRDERFRDKVIVIALAGSWCPNCQDEAEFLAPLYRAYRARGLEVVSLMFEHFGDAPRAVEAVRRFRERHEIEYTTLIAGISDKDDAASKLPQLNGVFAFPTTIFLDRAGRVRRVHTGFAGPATGEHHARLAAEFESRIQALLAEPTPPVRAVDGAAS